MGSRLLGDLHEAAMFFGGLVLEEAHIKHKALTAAGKVIQAEAKRVLGTYDYGWPKLSPDTIRRKKGQADTPGVETGKMQESIKVSEVYNDTIRIGSEMEEAVWFELGTTRGQPPRSFLMGAAQHKSAEVAHLVGHTVVTLTFKGRT